MLGWVSTTTEQKKMRVGSGGGKKHNFGRQYTTSLLVFFSAFHPMVLLHGSLETISRKLLLDKKVSLARLAKVASYNTSKEILVSCTQLVVLYAHFKIC